MYLRKHMFKVYILLTFINNPLTVKLITGIPSQVYYKRATEYEVVNYHCVLITSNQYLFSFLLIIREVFMIDYLWYWSI